MYSESLSCGYFFRHLRQLIRNTKDFKCCVLYTHVVGHEFCSYFLPPSQLKSRSSDSTEKLTIDQILKKFSAFYETESSEKFSQWQASRFLSCTTGINFTASHLCFKNNFNIIFSSLLILQSCLLPSSSATEPFTYFSCLQCVSHIPSILYSLIWKS